MTQVEPVRPSEVTKIGSSCDGPGVSALRLPIARPMPTLSPFSSTTPTSRSNS